MTSFKEYFHLIQETHFTDFYPKKFQEFYNKWKKHKKDRDLWVHFTNQKGDPLDRVGYDNPNHRDPIGIYCYPLQYVIDHPGDIWYGNNAKYIRVIKDKTPWKYTLYLDSMDYSDAQNTLYDMGLSRSNLELAAKRFPRRNKGKTKWGKLFMSAFQIDWDKTDDENIVTRSGQEQTELLKKAKKYALIDRSNRTSQAVINDREPEQALFIVPQYIEVLEVFRLSDTNRIDISRGNRTETFIARKIVALLLEQMNDKIVDSIEKTDSLFWSQKGKQIYIQPVDTSLQYRMKELKMGEKPHKYSKKYDAYAFKLTIYSSKGKTQHTIYADDKLEDAIYDIYGEWAKKPDIDNTFYSKKRYEDEEKREKDESIRKANEQEEIKLKKWWPEFANNYNSLMEHFNKPTRVDDDPENNSPFYIKMMMQWSKYIVEDGGKKDYYEKIESLRHVFDERDMEDFFDHIIPLIDLVVEQKPKHMVSVGYWLYQLQHPDNPDN